MDHAWIMHGLRVDYAWIIHGMCIDYKDYDTRLQTHPSGYELTHPTANGAF